MFKRVSLTSSLVTGVGTTDGGEISISFANLGSAEATVNAISLPAGASVKLGGMGYSLPTIPYVATGTSLRIDVERRY